MKQSARPSAPRPGRPRKLDHDQIASAVLAAGFRGLTVHAVAEQLGVGPATLYRYVPTRAGLLALAWQQAMTTHPWPSTHGPWDELLTAWAQSLWSLADANPGAMSELTGGPVPPAMAALYDDLAVELMARGFTAQDAVLAVDSVIDLTIDHRLGVERLDALRDGGTLLREELAAEWSAAPPQDPVVQPSDDTRRIAVRAVMVAAIQAPPRDWFTAKLTLVIAGIAQQLAPKQPD